jgi:hypothetical protein
VNLLVYIVTAEHIFTELANWYNERESGEMGVSDKFLENVVKFQIFGDCTRTLRLFARGR